MYSFIKNNSVLFVFNIRNFSIVVKDKQLILVVPGILTDIQDYFSIQDDKGGLLQTAFVLSYMIFAPLFGYLGDRYSRKAIMAAGVFLWSLTTLLGSFMDVSFNIQ